MIQRRKMVDSAAISSERERSANGDVLKGRVSRRMLALTRMLILACGVLALCGAEARAQSALDGFDPGTNGSVKALVVQPDGKIIVGGAFSMMGGGGTGTIPRRNIGRLNADGSLDTSFNPGADFVPGGGGEVNTLAVQPDGKIIVGGFFDTVGGQPHPFIGRLNSDGTADPTFNPSANDMIQVIAMQPDGKILVGGNFTMLNGQPRSFFGRLNADGSLDTTFNPGAGSVVLALSVQPNGKIVVGGFFNTLAGQSRSKIGRLNADGSLDTSFDPGADGIIFALALQADGKIVIGGDFNNLGGGGTGTSPHSKIGRLNPDGIPDATFTQGAGSIRALAIQADGKILASGISGISRFNTNGSIDTPFNPGADGAVNTLAIQADGKIVVGGVFTMLGGGGTGTTSRRSIGRLYADGSLDTTFNPGANLNVNVLSVQADGKILVGGDFNMLGGGGTGMTPHSRLGRLNADGSIDPTFNSGTNGAVYVFKEQPNGKFLVAGAFGDLIGSTGTTSRNFIGRFNADGSVDSTFNPGANNSVFALAIQADGKILVGGNFTMLGGGGFGTIMRNHIGRLNDDGTVDLTFNPGANFDVSALAVQANGKILVGGDFTGLGGGTGTIPRNFIGRFNADGSVDPTFDPGASNSVFVLAIQADGKVLVGGLFTGLGGGTGTTARSRIGRLTNTDAALQSLSVSFKGTSVRWLRFGASPELERVTFELSTDGINYTPLGNGSRINSSWLLTGLSLPAQQNIYVRARGFYAAGLRTGSYSVVESVRNAYITIPQAANGTPFDFDGDKLADVSIWNPNNQNWYVLQSGNNTLRVQYGWGSGALGDVSVPADYDGDGKTDIAVWRPSEGNFYVVQSMANAPAVRGWGGGADIPVPADYDGDGRADFAVFRPSEGNWYILNSQTNTVTLRGWGTSGDKPVAADYDADGRADIAVYRPSEGNWYIINSTMNTVTLRNWGGSTDKVVPADYDGDGRADLAVFRPSEGNWYILSAVNNTVTVKNWGGSTDIPVAADYDGDGQADIAVWRPSEGTWYIIQSAANMVRTSYLGGNGDVPAPSAFVR